MSYKTTDVSPNIINKRNSELLDDSMICDDANRTDCDVDGSKKQNFTNILKNKTEIPPKNDTPSSEVLSTCEPPKSKKRKLSSFDELLLNLDYGVLYTNLTKLLLFLESDNNKCIFFFTKDYEEFFEMIVQDINVLKSKSLDDNYRSICNKIIKAAAGKLLLYVLENNPGYHKKVMVIKKLHLLDQSGNSTASISCSSESLMPPSEASTKVDTNDQSRSLFPAAITSGFKIHCLRTLLVFIKNDAIKTKEFPELNTDQAKFMQLLLGNVSIDNFDSNCEVTELYQALVHAVKINKLKYEFRIKCDESWAGKTRVVFEKVPVLIPSETAVNSDQTAGKSKHSSGSLMPPSQTSTKVDTNDQSRSLFPAAITSDFKIHCLRTLLVFIKNDAIKTKEFPELNTDQAKFIQLVLEKVNTDNFDSNSEVTELYQALVHAVKKNELKYEFRIKCDESWAGQKRVVFEKVPVLIPSETAVNSDQTAGKSKQNPKNFVQNSEDPKTDARKPDDPNPEFSKPDAPKSHGPKIDVNKLDAFKTQDPKMDVPQTDAPKSQDPKIDEPDAPKSQASETCDSGAPNTEPPPDVAEPWFEKPKSLTLTKRQMKSENRRNFFKNTPKKLIGDTLNTILDFLLNDDMVTLVLVPKTPDELKFYRKCIIRCRSAVNWSQFGEEFRELHCRISHLLCRFHVNVTKQHHNAYNELTGLREVTYVKTLKKYISGSVTCTEAKETSDGGESQSTPKKPKVNVQNALQLAATDNIKLDKVLNLNQSLRSKKKDKKRKKAELKKAKKCKDASSSSSTSRDSSRDRGKAAMAATFIPPGPKVAKRPSSEISENPMNSFPMRRSVDKYRHVRLREAMSVPVHSEKALRMMLGMGWNGGALGARGDGITEPLMPALEIPRKAGFGLISHRLRTQNSNPDPVPVLKNPKEQNSPPAFVPGTDIVVEKTKQLLLEDVTFDTIINATDPAKFNVLPSKPSKNTVGLQKPNVDPSKPTNSKAQKLKNADLKFRLPFRLEMLHSIWDLINSDASCKSLEYDTRIKKKQRKFVNLAMQTLSSKKDNNAMQCVFQHDEIPLCKQIRNKYLETQMIVEARFFWNYMSIDLVKLPKKFNPPTPIVFENKENTSTINDFYHIINSENLHSYIFSSNGRTPETLKTIKNMQFKVLFLMNMLKFVKSLSEEYEVTFNKVLNAKEKLYMEKVVDEINMRTKFGSSPAETKLGDQIREHVKDAFLGIMYDHKHLVITLSKYYRFKRLNRPDNAVRRKSKATVNLDDFTIETLIEPKLNIDKPFDREIKYNDGEDNYEVSEDTNDVTETDNTQVSTERFVSDDETSGALPISNELGLYDSDDSSVEEYNNNNANAKVPKLLPGEEGVNISNFLYLYDTNKTNTAGIRNDSIINNDSASNMTENRNNKNNSGNGNVVIDNNDNQFIDMKRASGKAQDTQKENNVDSEEAEYVICVDYKEEVLNTEDLDPNSTVIEYSYSDNDCTENKAKDKIKNIAENLPFEDFTKETDVIIKGIDAVKTMKIISITEDLREGINTEPVHGIVKDDSNAVINIDNSNAMINLDDAVDVINKNKSKLAINPGYPIPVIITGETMAVIEKDESKAAVIPGKSKEVINKSEPMAIFNTVESSKDKKVAQIKEGTSINPSDENIVKDNLVIKSDCDRIKKDNIVISEEFCNAQSVKSSRIQTVGIGTDFLYDKDSEIKNVRIGHTHHPVRKLSLEKVEKIQWHISNCIKLATELPLLKCHGVQNGALFYTCHNKKTYDWLQNTIGVTSYAKVFDTMEVTKMALKLCGYFDYDSNYLFKMLEMYNKEMSTKEWVVEKMEKNGDYIIFIVKMDKFSIKFIQESDLTLFAGIDKVQFSLIWE